MRTSDRMIVDNFLIGFFQCTLKDLLKQERPSHTRDIIYPGMQERGRAIPPHAVPIIERPGLPGGLPPRPGSVVERRVSFGKIML